jgi:GT2 family glycosyltransferase
LKFSVVLITIGTRPTELQELIDSLGHLHPLPDEIVMVWNGAEPQPLGSPIPVKTSRNKTNVGVPGGRNIGASLASGDVIIFLDDDAAVATGDMLTILNRAFSSDPGLGAIGFRLMDPLTGRSLRRWTPRPRRSLSKGGEVSRFPGGAVAIRMSAFEKCGGFPTHFFFSHEETDLAWRLINAGFTIRYEPKIVVHHPPTDPGRHPDALHIGCRNRVWLARRLLPAPIAVLYLATWLLISLLRARTLGDLRATLSGVRAGIAEDAGDRQPMSWKTVWRLSRMGHPPVF